MRLRAGQKLLLRLRLYIALRERQIGVYFLHPLFKFRFNVLVAVEIPKPLFLFMPKYKVYILKKLIFYINKNDSKKLTNNVNLNIDKLDNSKELIKNVNFNKG